MIDKVFCNVPWKEVHINADGTYHTCGAQPNRVYGTPAAAQYNVHIMTIPEWVASEHQHAARVNKLSGINEPLCAMCYHEDAMGSSSKRVKENHKDGIDPVNFYKTFDQRKYENIAPRINSFHISLGNECNLACRMCTPMASSKIAVQEIKAGTFRGAARMNWTEDQQAWDHVTDYICGSKDLEFVHLIGGEPLLNPRFEQLIDRLLLAGKNNIYLGFTTNGTVFNQSLMQKLNAFRHVDVGVSIECTGELNDLIRQGSSTQTVLDNIDLYLKHRKQGHVYVTVRAVPSALSVHTLDDLYRWCVSREVDVMTNMLVRPAYQQIQHLPQDIKKRLLEQYSKWEHSEPAPADSNPRDPTWFKQHIDNEIKAIIKALELPGDPVLTQELYEKLTLWQWLKQPQITNYFTTSIKA
jgi:MoaA/NifB/PqqE/SkfB family radical SAM enzyme